MICLFIVAYLLLLIYCSNAWFDYLLLRYCHEYVDIEYGTGCLKVTPAHDHNDKLLGEKHNLEFIDILNDDASLNDICLH